MTQEDMVNEIVNDELKEKFIDPEVQDSLEELCPNGFG